MYFTRHLGYPGHSFPGLCGDNPAFSAAAIQLFRKYGETKQRSPLPMHFFYKNCCEEFLRTSGPTVT
jgi:hypothetical protein